jgi:carbamoyl-phosphate synthase large subunit
MSKYNILITGTGGCGVGEGLYKALENNSEYNLFTCNNGNNSLYIFNNPANSFIVGSANGPGYCEAILQICLDHSIIAVLPGSEPELVILVNNRDLFEQQGISIYANTDKVINTFDNKWETFIRLSDLGIKTPDTTVNANDADFFSRNSFPLIIKPVIGNASKNVYIIDNHKELACVKCFLDLKKIPFVIQQHIGNAKEEYTISVLSDFKGEYLGSIVLKRILAGGFSQFVECEEYDTIDLIAQEIAQKVESKGPLNIQCRMMNNELYVFEINPRFSGTSPFRALLGFNEPDILFNKSVKDINVFNREMIKYNHFGVRGFSEAIYSNEVKSKVSKY